MTLQLEPEAIRRYYDEVYYSRMSSTSPLPEVFRTYYDEYYRGFLEAMEVMPGKRLLDVGCGRGELLAQAETLGLRVYGVDFSWRAVATANANTERAHLYVADAADLPFADCLFDYITCLGVLEHVHRMQSAIKEMLRVGKRGCTLCILVPNKYSYLNLFHYHVTDQLINRDKSYREWAGFFKGFSLEVCRVVRDNHPLERPDSSTRLKHFVKKMIRPSIPLIPVKLSFQIGFICRKL